MRNTGVVLTAVAVLLAGWNGGVTDDACRPRHLIYLHGRIVQEQQSKRPRHPQYGYYEVEKILDTFRSRGFVVSGEIRPKSASMNDSADRVVEQVRKLLESGVRADEVTVVGASMGAAIALLASVRLQNPDVRFCVLGVCLSEIVSGLVAEEGKDPSGHVLSIREASDDLTGACPSWKNDLKYGRPLVAREIVLHTGLSHGFLYRPLPEWVNPIVEWAGDARKHQAAEPAPLDEMQKRTIGEAKCIRA
jgi:pimeloyl-ACP methyl ester carboxylesterase